MCLFHSTHHILFDRRIHQRRSLSERWLNLPCRFIEPYDQVDQETKRSQAIRVPVWVTRASTDDAWEDGGTVQ